MLVFTSKFIFNIKGIISYTKVYREVILLRTFGAYYFDFALYIELCSMLFVYAPLVLLIFLKK